MNMIWYIAQGLGVMSYLIYWSSKFFNKKKHMLLMDYLCRAVGIASFLLVNNIDGIKGEILALFRGLAAYKVMKKSTKTKIITSIIIWLITISVFLYDFAGISTIFIMVVSSIYIFSTILGNEQTMRLSGLIAGVFYLAFEISTKMYGGAICEAIGIIVITISYIRAKKMNEGENK